MIRGLALAVALLTPDCQPLCLGVCWYDWAKGYCMDTRVARLGTWDVVPWYYSPPQEREYPAWVLPYPSAWGEYPTERYTDNLYGP